MKKTEEQSPKKTLEEMNIIDNFLFTELVSDEEKGKLVCRLILECVLKRKVGKIDFTVQRTVPGIKEDTHGIRMDAYITERMGKDEDDFCVYDIEPEKNISKRSELPKRSRYYGDLIDVQLLDAGTDYEKLPDLVTIMILSYDPFGADDMYYEAGTVIKTHTEKSYNDGIRRIFLYVDGNLPDDADEDDIKIKNLLRYIGKSTEENVVDDTTRQLSDIVRFIKAKKDVGVRYMKSWERERELIEEGREEERLNTEAERKRADTAEKRADTAEKRADTAERRADTAEKRADAAERRVKELEAMLFSHT